MKILLLSTIYHIEGRPDLFHDTSAIHYLVKHWTKDNEVRVLNTYTHSYKKVFRFLNADNRKNYRTGYSFEKDGVKVRLVEIQKAPGQGCYFLRHQRKRIMAAFTQLVDDGFVPDVIITHFPSSSSYYLPEIQQFYNKRIPVVGVLHKTDVVELEKGRFRAGLLDRNCDVVFSRSDAIYKRAKKFDVKHLRDTVISSGVPINKKANSLENAERNNEVLSIIYVGKFIKRKHVDVIIQTLGRIRDIIDARLELVGDGEELAAIRQLVTKLKLESSVQFTGSVPRETVLQKMQKADLLCVPSTNETFGLVYLEAMSVGCVPIGTREEGIDGIVKDGINGYLVDRENMVDSLEHKITAFAEMTNDEKKKMSEQAVITASEYGEESRSAFYYNNVKSVLLEMNKNQV